MLISGSLRGNKQPHKPNSFITNLKSAMGHSTGELRRMLPSLRTTTSRMWEQRLRTLNGMNPKYNNTQTESFSRWMFALEGNFVRSERGSTSSFSWINLERWKKERSKKPASVATSSYKTGSESHVHTTSSKEQPCAASCSWGWISMWWMRLISSCHIRWYDCLARTDHSHLAIRQHCCWCRRRNVRRCL